jgi:hypothetical protein
MPNKLTEMRIEFAKGKIVECFSAIDFWLDRLATYNVSDEEVAEFLTSIDPAKDILEQEGLNDV